MPPRERLSPKKTVGFLRRLTPRIRPYRFALVGAAVLMLMSTGVGLAFPLIVRELLDVAFLANNSGLLNRVALGLLGLSGVQAVATFGQSYLTASVSERVVADLIRDLFSFLVHQPPGFFASRRSDALVFSESSVPLPKCLGQSRARCIRGLGVGTPYRSLRYAASPRLDPTAPRPSW